jgi:hypothetical protein
MKIPQTRAVKGDFKPKDYVSRLTNMEGFDMSAFHDER